MDSSVHDSTVASEMQVVPEVAEPNEQREVDASVALRGL